MRGKTGLLALGVVMLLGCGRSVNDGFGLFSGTPGGLVAGMSPGDKWSKVEGELNEAFELKDIDTRNKLLKAEGRDHTLKIKIELNEEAEVAAVLARLRGHGDGAIKAESYVLGAIKRLRGTLDEKKTVCQAKPEIGCVWSLVNEPQAPNMVFSWTGIRGTEDGKNWYEAVNQVQLANYGKSDKEKAKSKASQDDIAKSFARLSLGDPEAADGHLRIGRLRLGDNWSSAKDKLDESYEVSDLGPTEKLLSAEGKGHTTTIALHLNDQGRITEIEARMRGTGSDAGKLEAALEARIGTVREKLTGIKASCKEAPEVGCEWPLAATPTRPKGKLSWAGLRGEEGDKKWFEVVASASSGGAPKAKPSPVRRSVPRRRRRPRDGWGRF